MSDTKRRTYDFIRNTITELNDPQVPTTTKIHNAKCALTVVAANLLKEIKAVDQNRKG